MLLFNLYLLSMYNTILSFKIPIVCAFYSIFKVSLFSPNMLVQSSAFLVGLPTGVHQGSRCDTFCEWRFGPHLGFCWGRHNHPLHLLNEVSCHSAQNLCTGNHKSTGCYILGIAPHANPNPFGWFIGPHYKEKAILSFISAVIWRVCLMPA